MRMKFFRILPEIWASTSWPLGKATRNMVPGRTCVTEPVNSIGSSLATPFQYYLFCSVSGHRCFPQQGFRLEKLWVQPGKSKPFLANEKTDWTRFPRNQDRKST